MYTDIDNDITITKEKNNIYSIFFSLYTDNRSTNALIQSITKTNIINGATISSDYKTLKFKAISVKSLSEYISLRENVCLLLKHIITQLQYLITQTKHTFIGFNPKNIWVIDDNKFVYLSIEHLHLIHDNNVTITCPFSEVDFFCSPELKRVKQIPCLIHYKTCYYSLGCLIINEMLDEKEQEEQEQEQEEQEQEEQEQEQNNLLDFKEKLDSLFIKDTKLYWFLKRCLHEVPMKRSLLFI